MLGVAASVLAVVRKQMQQLQAMLGPAVYRGKGTVTWAWAWAWACGMGCGMT